MCVYNFTKVKNKENQINIRKLKYSVNELFLNWVVSYNHFK